ncbi:MAG: type domain protein [Belnapia sp.]|nr:type domain protein [Belnapia sp.]
MTAPAAGNIAAPAAGDIAAPAAGDRVVFSVLYNESAEFLGRLTDNFLAHTGPEAVLVLNLPAAAPGEPLPVIPPAAAGRVFAIRGTVARRKLGHTLLAGHLEAFGFAQEKLGAFGHFCPLASNSLMVRRFDRAAALRLLAETRLVPQIDLADPPDMWWWPFIRRNPRVIRSLAEDWGITRSLGSQIEGLFAARADWGLLHARFADVLALGGLMEPADVFPLEEVLPVAVFLNHGSGHYINICHVHWTRPDGGKVTVGDLLDLAADHPPHICAMKWFDRSGDAPPTAAVTEAWSLGLLAALGEADANQRLGQRLLLEQFTAALRTREVFTSFGEAWGEAGFGFGPDVLAVRGGRLAIPTGAVPAEAAYLYLAETGEPVTVTLEVAPGPATRVRLGCHAMADGLEASSGRVVGHLYLSPLRDTGHWTCRLRLAPAGEAAIGHVTLAAGGRYQPIRPHHATAADGWCEYYFRCGDAPVEGQVWFGLPLLAGVEYQVLLDLIG